MSGSTIGDAYTSKSKEVSPAINEVALFKQLIKERAHPLDLLRELLSNAGAEQVAASKIEIGYTQDKEGHIFEVTDDGCGMNYTGRPDLPGRLDRFLGLGLSGIVGIQSDEFSWKGLGSKLSFQSRRVEIETCIGDPHPLYDVRINEPWETLERNNVPKPRIGEYPTQAKGTRVRVVGHPPHRKEDPFTLEKIVTYLSHRTFAGFTRDRRVKPRLVLSVLGHTEEIAFGFPEFAGIDFVAVQKESFVLDEPRQTLFVSVASENRSGLRVNLKGFLTWRPEAYLLSRTNKNIGLILSVKGIPYFALDMEEYGATSIRTARPGEERTCLVVECDGIQDEMNISRSALVDSARTVELKRMVADLFQRIESSDKYLVFRRMPEKGKVEKLGGVLAEEKRRIESADQNWVVLERSATDLIVLIREPQNESEVNALIWKLEALCAFPFEQFSTLAYIGASKGPDLLANFQEEKASEPFRATVIEVENNFYNYKTHGHSPSQYPKVICWDVPTSGRKAKINKTGKPYKFTVSTEEYQVHIYAIRYMDRIRVMTRQELNKRGITI